MTLQLYRGTTLGITLQETLTEMMDKGLISSDLSNRVLELFDKHIQEELLKHLPTESHLAINAKEISSYRYYDQVWTFVLKDVNLKPIGFAKKLKIIAIDSRMVGSQGLQEQPFRDRRLEAVPKNLSFKKLLNKKTNT